MPRISEAGPSNNGAIGIQQILLLPSVRREEGQEATSSAGTSFSPSEKKLDKSGFSPQDTESSSQSPALTTENPSSPGQATTAAPSSSADSADGNTQETGSSQSSQQLSSEGSTQPTQDTLLQAPSEETPSGGGFLVPNPALAREKYMQAGELYRQGKYDEVTAILDEVFLLDPGMAAEIEQARIAVDAAKAQ